MIANGISLADGNRGKEKAMTLTGWMASGQKKGRQQRAPGGGNGGKD
jgi:hypothetical protein